MCKFFGGIPYKADHGTHIMFYNNPFLIPNFPIQSQEGCNFERKYFRTKIRYRKAIVGQGQKFMLTLFERSTWEGTNTFYGESKLIFVQNLLQFEICDFSSISYKK